MDPCSRKIVWHFINGHRKIHSKCRSVQAPFCPTIGNWYVPIIDLTIDIDARHIWYLCWCFVLYMLQFRSQNDHSCIANMKFNSAARYIENKYTHIKAASFLIESCAHSEQYSDETELPIIWRITVWNHNEGWMFALLAWMSEQVERNR